MIEWVTSWMMARNHGFPSPETPVLRLPIFIYSSSLARADGFAMTGSMRIAAILFCSVFSLSMARAQTLTAPDREALLENLEKLRKNIDSRDDARFRLAINAYNEALASDEKAIEFYLMCIEKVEYNDMKRKNKDFRDWKKKEEGNLAKLGFRRALRHQLRWLALTLQAASSGADRIALTERAKLIVRDVFNDLEMMGDQEKVLTQAVTSTVFAKAYGLDGMKMENWPSSPMNLEDLYEQLFLPPYRNPAHVQDLRATWLKRIEQELAIRENMAVYARRLLQEQQRKEEEYQTRNSPNEQNQNYNETRIGTVESMRPPEYKQFLADEVPELLWRMEIDLYRSGDESGAAKRMLDHLAKYIDHKSAAKWGEEFTALLKSKEPQPTGPANAKPPIEAGAETTAQ